MAELVNSHDSDSCTHTRLQVHVLFPKAKHSDYLFLSIANILSYESEDTGMVKKWLSLVIAIMFLIVTASALAEDVSSVSDSSANEFPTDDNLPLSLPIFETETFLLTDARWSRPDATHYWYTFKGTGMNAETILALMKETGHTLVQYTVDPLTASTGVGHTAYYTYEGDHPLTLFPVGSPEGMFSVVIAFSHYEDGSCKMTLFCSQELMYEVTE